MFMILRSKAYCHHRC